MAGFLCSRSKTLKNWQFLVSFETGSQSWLCFRVKKHYVLPWTVCNDKSTKNIWPRDTVRSENDIRSGLWTAKEIKIYFPDSETTRTEIERERYIDIRKGEEKIFPRRFESVLSRAKVYTSQWWLNMGVFVMKCSGWSPILLLMNKKWHKLKGNWEI